MSDAATGGQAGLGERPTRVRWLVFWLASLSSWMLYLHRYTWNVIRPELAEEFGFSNTQLEGIFTVFYIGYGIGQIPSGIACDLFGAHLFLGSIILLWSLLLPCIALTASPYALGGIRVLFGGAQAGCYPSLGQVTRAWFPRNTRTQVQGWIASFFGRGGGAMSSIIMATVLMGYCGLSWRLALVVLAGAGAVFAAAFLILYRSAPEKDRRANEAERRLIRAGEPPQKGRRMLPFGEAFRSRSLRVLVFQQFMNAGADIVYTSVMGSYFLSKGISKGEMGLLVSLPLWGGAVGGITGGYLNDWLILRTGSRRRGRAIVGVGGKVLAAAALFVAILQRDPLAAGIGLFVVKFFSDWSQPTVWGTCTDLGGRYSATVFSINNTAGNVGALVTPLLVGPLLDWNTTTRVVEGVEVGTTNYIPMFWLVGTMYLIAACCWLAIDPTRPIAAEEE